MNSIIEKKCKVVMLPTDEKSTLYINEYRTNDRLVSSKDISYHEINSQGNPTTIELLEQRGYKAQHLYILSDDEIKENDLPCWCISDLVNSKPFECTNLLYAKQFSCKKIIAATDTSLDVEIIKSQKEDEMSIIKNVSYILPQPSQQFITKFIEEYNQNNVISECLVEYEDVLNYINAEAGNFEPNLVLKVDKNNTITIKRLKESWNRAELIYTLKSYREFAWNNGISPQDLDKWISNNL